MHRFRNNAVTISPGFYLQLAMMLMLLPLRWCLAAAAAAVFHELCHLATLRICGGQAGVIRIGPSGTLIETSPLPPWKAVLCSLAGPAGSFLLLLTARWIPRIALCAAMQGAYNLLPLQPLDGGHTLRVLADWLLPRQKAEILCRWTAGICLGALTALGIYGCFFLKLGLMPLLLAAILYIRFSGRKIPCKTSRLWVQ